MYEDNDTEDIKTDVKTASSKTVAFNSVSSIKSSKNHIKTASDALDRAMSLVEQNIQNCAKDKQFLEDLNETKHNENENIKVIETSTSDENFLGMSELGSTENTDRTSSEYNDIFNQAFIASKTFSCSSKVSSESPISLSDQQSKHNSQKMKNGISSLNNNKNTPVSQQDQTDFELNKRKYVTVDNTTKNIKDEIRRRSLPARLNNVPVPFNLENRSVRTETVEFIHVLVIKLLLTFLL